MNRIHRAGPDPDVAFLLRAKRRLQASLMAGDHADAHRHSEALAESIGLQPPVVSATTSGMKGMLRRIARFVYRRIKPVVRPIAFRMRRYFVQSLHDVVQSLHDDLAYRIRVSESALREEICRTTESLRSQRQGPQVASVDAFMQTSSELLSAIDEAAMLLWDQTREAHASSQHAVEEQILMMREWAAVSETKLSEVRDRIATCEATLSAKIDRIEQYGLATAHRAAVYCGDGEVLVRTGAGYVLCPASDHALLSLLLETGELELGTRLFIQQFLRPGDTFVDVGANVGLHTLAAAHALGGRGKIFAFEPFEPTARLLRKSVWMNGFAELIDIHKAAVSDHAGLERLHLGITSGHHSLFPLETMTRSAMEPVDVPLVRLDQVIPADRKVALIKIDAEGAELEIVESAASIIRANPDIALIVEFGASHLQRVGRTVEEWFRVFDELALRHRVIDASSGALEDWTRDRLETAGSANLFFARENSLAWSRVA
jgi:FkbM family methyltransferase